MKFVVQLSLCLLEYFFLSVQKVYYKLHPSEVMKVGTPLTVLAKGVDTKKTGVLILGIPHSPAAANSLLIEQL